MTAERTEAVQFDTLEEVERLESAGVPRDHAAAMLYAAVRASDARYGALDAKIEALDTKIDRLADTMNEKFAAVDDNFKAVYGRFDSIDLNFKATDTRFDTVDDRFKAADAKATGMRWQWVAIGLLSGGVAAAASQTIAVVAKLFR